MTFRQRLASWLDPERGTRLRTLAQQAELIDAQRALLATNERLLEAKQVKIDRQATLLATTRRSCSILATRAEEAGDRARIAEDTNAYLRVELAQARHPSRREEGER